MWRVLWKTNQTVQVWLATYPSPKTDLQATSELSCDQYLSHTVNHTPNWNTCSRPSYSLLPPTNRAEGVGAIPVTRANGLPVTYYIQFTCYMNSLPVTLTVYLFSRTICLLIVLYSLPVMCTNSLPVTHSNTLPVMLTVYLSVIRKVYLLHVQFTS